MNQMWSQSDSNSDVKIVAGSEPNIKEFSAHSSVLRSRSLYFQRALSERWKDKKHDIYIITKPNIHPNIFMLILDYIYTRKTILPESAEDSLSILIASDELELLDLIECSQKHLIKKFSSWLLSNLVMSLNVVCRHNHFHELYDHVLKFTFRNLYSLFNSSDLPLLDEVAMICLLESDELELEEIEIWNYLIKWSISKFLDDDITNWSDESVSRWSDEHFVALKETISRCIPLIRYYHIPKNYINKQIKRYKLNSNAFIKTKTPPRRRSRLMTNENKAIISSWIDKKDNDYYTCMTDPYKFKLLLRGSRDGFDVNTFHRLCDFQGPTIVIIKTVQGDLVGGYNSVNWDSFRKNIYKSQYDFNRSNVFTGDDEEILKDIFLIPYYTLKKESYFRTTLNSFIFSFTDQSNPVLSRVKAERKNVAIRNDEQRGPSFGTDLCMENSTRWTSYWGTYEHEITKSNHLIAEEFEPKYL
ncbi:kelch-like protein 17 [Gigaspora margarita]|uniref:Kelch-like protein 17 n=1 Tax=Gigaspora margarita TaxID=4874 RepID=A0A8H3ZY36_GIGMA|nr:kelch-like protein 17 [Gigaspora margarita]